MNRLKQNVAKKAEEQDMNVWDFEKKYPDDPQGKNWFIKDVQKEEIHLNHQIQSIEVMSQQVKEYYIAQINPLKQELADVQSVIINMTSDLPPICGAGGGSSSNGVVVSNPYSISISTKLQNKSASSYETSTWSDLPHHNRRTWFFPQADRTMAENLLHGKNHGTFLIRKSADGLFALSIVCNGAIEHCKIFKTPQVHIFEGFFVPGRSSERMNCKRTVIFFQTLQIFPILHKLMQ